MREVLEVAGVQNFRHPGTVTYPDPLPDAACAGGRGDEERPPADNQNVDRLSIIFWSRLAFAAAAR